MSLNVQNQVKSQQHKYEVTNRHHHNTRLHITTPPHMRVVVPEHKTSSAIPKIILPRDRDLVADSPTQSCLSEHPQVLMQLID